MHQGHHDANNDVRNDDEISSDTPRPTTARSRASTSATALCGPGPCQDVHWRPHQDARTPTPGRPKRYHPRHDAHRRPRRDQRLTSAPPRPAHRPGLGSHAYDDDADLEAMKTWRRATHALGAPPTPAYPRLCPAGTTSRSSYHLPLLLRPRALMPPSIRHGEAGCGRRPRR